MIKNYEQKAENFANRPIQRDDFDLRIPDGGFIESALEHDHVLKADEKPLQTLIQKADGIKSKYSDICQQSPFDQGRLKKERAEEYRDFLENVEAEKTVMVGQIKFFLDEAQKGYQKDYNTFDGSKSLNLERAKLEAAVIAEEEIIHRIAEARRTGTYDRDQMLAYAGKSDDVAQAVKRLFDEIPAWTASPSVQADLRHLEALLSAGPGKFPYRLNKGSGDFQTFEAMSLFYELPKPPTPEQIKANEREGLRKTREREMKNELKKVKKLRKELETEKAALKKGGRKK